MTYCESKILMSTNKNSFALASALIGPFENRGPLDAVLGEARSVGNGAEREACGFAEHVHGALVAR